MEQLEPIEFSWLFRAVLRTGVGHLPRPGVSFTPVWWVIYPRQVCHLPRPGGSSTPASVPCTPPWCVIYPRLVCHLPRPGGSFTPALRCTKNSGTHGCGGPRIRQWHSLHLFPAEGRAPHRFVQLGLPCPDRGRARY